MKIQNLVQKWERWRASREDLLSQIAALKAENERLREKAKTLQQAKDQAERHAEERRKEKESLRERLLTQKKAGEANEAQVEQFGAKITELRAEIDRLSRRKKK